MIQHEDFKYNEIMHNKIKKVLIRRWKKVLNTLKIFNVIILTLFIIVTFIQSQISVKNILSVKNNEDTSTIILFIHILLSFS